MQLRVWSISTGDIVCELKGHQAAVLDVCTMSDDRFASASEDRTVRVWSVELQIELCRHMHSATVTRVLALDRGAIASASMDHTVRVWPPMGAGVVIMEKHRAAVRSLAIGAGRLVSGSDDKTLRMWRAPMWV